METAKLNVQGLSRRDEGLMGCLIPNDGDVVVAVDAASGEPTIVAHYSRDKRYAYMSLNGIGKQPFYEDRILMCDDIYLAAASVSPVGQEIVRKAFNKTYNGLTFSELWVKDKDLLIKEADLKAIRTLHKVLVLAIMYGQAPKGMCKTASDAGFKLGLEDAKTFYNQFWLSLFPDVRKLRDRLIHFAEQNGYVTNDFGFRSYPQEARKGFNYFIQSSVSSLMDLFAGELMTKLGDDMKFKAYIHDEIVFHYPKTKVADIVSAVKEATDSVNNMLKWSVPIRFNVAVGSNWYELK